MSINIGGGELKELKPRILVMGIGGAGGNAINAMIESGLEGVEFVAVNTDAQDLRANKADAKIQIGMNLTKGLGAGAKHDIGQAAADESLNEIVSYIQGSNMIFITSGMGGGTGTGASHIIARAAKEMNILTVGVTTLPFAYEGPKRMRRALQGLEELKKHLDTTIVVPNQNLFKIADEGTKLKEAFTLSNDVLKHGVQSVTDLMVRPGMVNLDFADVETIMSAMGKAMMGTGEAEGENRAEVATEMALNNPLIDEYSLKGAKGLLVNITGGEDITLFEVDKSVNAIRAEVDPEAELIFGAIQDEKMNGKIRVSVVATALDRGPTDNKPILNVVNQTRSRNNGYSENLFSNKHLDKNLVNSIEGATALKLDENLEIHQDRDSTIITTNHSEEKQSNDAADSVGLSLENASYIEENLKTTEFKSKSENSPKLFNSDEEISEMDISKDIKEDDLFEKDFVNDEEFEIPAFLRKQKY